MDIILLTDKQKKFADEYLLDLNGTQAAIRAGYSKKSATEQASVLMAKANISQYIKQKLQERAKRTEIDADWVLKRFVAISDRCMSEITPVLARGDDGKMQETGEYQFDSAGANKATEMIAKHLGWFEKDNGQSAAKINIKVGYGKRD